MLSLGEISSFTIVYRHLEHKRLDIFGMIRP